MSSSSLRFIKIKIFDEICIGKWSDGICRQVRNNLQDLNKPKIEPFEASAIKYDDKQFVSCWFSNKRNYHDPKRLITDLWIVNFANNSFEVRNVALLKTKYFIAEHFKKGKLNLTRST